MDSLQMRQMRRVPNDSSRLCRMDSLDMRRAPNDFSHPTAKFTKGLLALPTSHMSRNVVLLDTCVLRPLFEIVPRGGHETNRKFYFHFVLPHHELEESWC